MRISILSIALTAIVCTLSSSVTACESSGQCQSGYRTAYLPRVATHRKAIVEPSPIEMEAGASYRLAGGGYGGRLGSIVLRIGGLDMECDVLTWSDSEVTFQVPPLKIKRVVTGKLHLVSWNGRSLSSKPIRLHGIVVERVFPVEPNQPRIESLEPLGQTLVPGGQISPSAAPTLDLGQDLE